MPGVTSELDDAPGSETAAAVVVEDDVGQVVDRVAVQEAMYPS